MADRLAVFASVVVLLAAIPGCKTVTRQPVAFAAASGVPADGVAYSELGWVTGRSCEEYAGLAEGGAILSARVGDRARPRSMRMALEQAMAKVPKASFLTSVTVEDELTTETFKPVLLCTVVSGIAMGRDTPARKRPRPDADAGDATSSERHRPDLDTGNAQRPSPSTTDRPVVGDDDDD